MLLFLITIKVEDFGVSNILLDEKSNKNILIYDVLHKTLIFRKLLGIDGLIRNYDCTEYLVLFGFQKYNAIYDRIRYLIGLKSGITYVYFS